MDPTSGDWPCEFPAAQTVKLKVAPGGGTGGGTGGGGFGGTEAGTGVLVAQSELQPGEIQDLGDIIPQLLEIKNKADVPLKFHVRIELGDGTDPPNPEAAAQVNTLLEDMKEGFSLQ